MENEPGKTTPAYLVLEDGEVFSGFSFGADIQTSGEVVFNTGMVGYPESFTDPSYRGQILVLTYPLIGNYGVPSTLEETLHKNFESDRIHISGLVVSDYSKHSHHWQSESNLSEWLAKQRITGIYGVDTRAITKKLRDKGSMWGKIKSGRGDPCGRPSKGQPQGLPLQNRYKNLVASVSIPSPKTYEGGKKRVALVDCGCKNTIIHSILSRGCTVIRVPWDYDVTKLDVDGVLFSNGPGDPVDVSETIRTAKKVMNLGLPTFGICLGNQIMALATGAKTYKLKFGHRSQNQPCRLADSNRCFITSQNHGYAIDIKTLPNDWEEWFVNMNDGTNEGVRHKTKPFMSVQFHPEAKPGPIDTGFLFDEFVENLK